MKTSEFIKRLKDVDLSVAVGDRIIEVYYKKDKIMVIEMNKLWGIDTRFHHFNKMPENIRKVAIIEAMEYINTPLEERQEHKKYYLRLPIPCHIDKRYLNREKRHKTYFFSDNEEYGTYQTKFTQEEIDEMSNQDFTQSLIKEEVQ